MQKGQIITLSGMSGVGKSYFINHLLENSNDFEKLRAVTTRKPRKDEVDGVDKYFITRDEFQSQNENGQLCVVNEVFGNMYGYYKKDIEKVNQGINLITELYYSEIPSFKLEHPNTISIYIIPNDVAVAIENIEDRQLEASELEKRMSDIKNELEFFSTLNKDCFDYILVNEYNMHSVTELKSYLSSMLGIEIATREYSDKLSPLIPQDIKTTVDNFANKEAKSIVYTSFDGDDMHYLNDICQNVINQGKIPLNPESALGYYVSTVTLGGVKQKVMEDCLTLELLANELYVYRNETVDISEGIIAEIMLWDMMKNSGFTFVSDVRDLDNAKLQEFDKSQLCEWTKTQDPMLRQELLHNLIDDYLSIKHNSAYIIANFKNFKHIDWARAYCYNHSVCPISPQNILPFSQYKNNQVEYLEARLELLRRADRVMLFIDRFNENEEVDNLDLFSKAELYYLKKYLPDKQFSIVGWDQANVPKYDKGTKWSLTTKEDIETRRLIKTRV